MLNANNSWHFNIYKLDKFHAPWGLDYWMGFNNVCMVNSFLASRDFEYFCLHDDIRFVISRSHKWMHVL